MCATQLSLRRDTLGPMPRRPRYTNDQLAIVVAQSSTMHGVLKALGLYPGGGNYESVRRRMASLGLDATHLERRQSELVSSDVQLRDAVAASRSFAQVLARLGHKPGGRIQSSVKLRVRAMGLDTDHFSGQSWRRNSRIPVVAASPLDQVLVEGRLAGTAHLKRRLLDAGLKQACCEGCGRRRWNGTRIPLELDHVNGRRNDNRLSNLRVLCPNCHAQTPTYRGRNIGGTRVYSQIARVPER
jgi:5-methylcytosine-specific restriction endonuclease McrA